MLLFFNLLVFKREEKSDYGGTLADAAEKLTSKMESWNPLFFGDLPYIFGYALSGTLFQMYALFPDQSQHYAGGSPGVRKCPIGDKLDLAYLSARVTLLQYS